MQRETSARMVSPLSPLPSPLSPLPSPLSLPPPGQKKLPVIPSPPPTKTKLILLGESDT